MVILDHYKWLIDLYVLDFFVDNHWAKISQIWKNFIDDLTAEDLAYLLDLEGKIQPRFKKVWPLEILALKSSIKAYSLQREPWSRSEISTKLNIQGLYTYFKYISFDSIGFEKNMPKILGYVL